MRRLARQGKCVGIRTRVKTQLTSLTPLQTYQTPNQISSSNRQVVKATLGYQQPAYRVVTLLISFFLIS